ncbi:MAG: radical SAM protein [Thermodesulfobacteriota bacterium]|nr:radical SAM protein [Thermodesulfobacteriota bacterium]
MKPLIIPIFVIYRGCPNRCVFCNERITAGNYPDKLTEDTIRNICDRHLKNSGRKFDQIAFYGGNFTGIDRGYQIELLDIAQSYVNAGMINSIRISTRPDYIDDDRVALLTRYNVSTVEIGAQSMVDEVLSLSGRGHSSEDVRNAVRLLRGKGIETGVHLMVGLPGDTRERFEYTVEEIIRIRPDTVRIHPTIVFKDTPLAKSYLEGKYRPPTLDDAVELCKHALLRFQEAGIPVIRLGLHTTKEMEADNNIIAGPFHPAFRSLVEGAIFLDMASDLLKSADLKDRDVVFSVAPKDVSNLRGMKNRNMKILEESFNLTEIQVIENSNQERWTLKISN